MSDYRQIAVSTGGNVVIENDLHQVAVIRFNAKRIADEIEIQELGEDLLAFVGATKTRAVILDFEGVEFLSSAVLAHLIEFHNQSTKAGQIVKMAGLSHIVRQTFEITQLDRKFAISGSLEEAEAAF